MIDQKKSDRIINFFSALKHTKGEFYGRSFSPLPWEEKILRDVYGTVGPLGLRQYQTIYLEIPKKNGKSTLVAGTGLYHTIADGEKNGEVYGCAAEREQASIVFDTAVDMIDQIPALRKRTRLNLSKKLLTDTLTGTFYQVLSAESYSKHGLNPSAVIFDELHAQPNRDLYDVMTFGAGSARRQPIWWVITTAGDDPDRVSICWEVHEMALQILEARRQGDAERDDPSWYPVVFGYEGDDIYNESNWKKANPSLGVTIQLETVRAEAKKAKMSAANKRLFLWLRLNQWITTKLTTWLPIDLFDKTVGKWRRNELLGKKCYLGQDLSSSTDLSAICLIFPPQEGLEEWRVIWDCWIPANGMEDRIRNDHIPYDVWVRNFWLQVTPGDVVDYNLIKERILEIKKLYQLMELDSDRTFAAMLLQQCETEGITCVDVPQTFAQLTDPMNVVEVLLKTGKMTHEANPVARWCFGNTSIAKNGNGQIKYVKEHKGKSVDRTKRIDLMAALVIGMARARFFVPAIDVSAAILEKDWGM
jgi:phage terminase large subunit-like protein